MSFRKLFYFLVLFAFSGLLTSCSSNNENRESRILIFSKTTGFRHASIPDGIKALQALGARNNVVVDTTENAENFNEENLKRYDAVVFLNTTGDILDHYQKAEFERYIQAGGGFVGLHSAADTEYNWPWYGKLVGGYFASHPDPSERKAIIDVVDRDHPTTSFLPERWERTDEWYDFKSINPQVRVLAKLDTSSYEGGRHFGREHPIAWYHEYDGGRAFYTGGGHTSESFSEPLFLKHLWGGIQYAMIGSQPLNYSLASTQRVPEENRFEVNLLDQNLDEPTELAVMKDGKVLFIERKGGIKLYDPQKEETRLIVRLDVNTTFEDGLMGLALDPHFEKNNWIYLYYSPAGEKPVQFLSRFDFKGDSLIMESEKLLLEVPVQRETCCHTGGSIEFDVDGNLYLSTGDDTNPFASNGYGPIDERSGRSSWDAQRSSGNTNDLRGKILRIKPQADGTYTIPEGNLFPANEPLARPEIYVMGNRNPYRISLDPKTKFLYWGEVGPDAGENNEKRGTRGYDEVNQAKKAGFFGWPYFVGDNNAYRRFDFKDSISGDYFEVDGANNNSPNNTGLKKLPPAQKAFIWYPYAESPEFPSVGKGGRNAMAGPVFYSDQFKNARQKFPEYFEGKLFIYDWVRGWIKLVTMDGSGNFQKMEPFMPNTKWNAPIDMEFGQDGSLYILTYGSGWFSQNPDATLVRVDYNAGNRKPVVQLVADKSVGGAPLEVSFSSKGTLDYDKDELQYHWKFTDDPKESSNEVNPTFVFNKPGIYNPILTVTDAHGEKTSKSIEILVGNDLPVVKLDISNNKSFYWGNTKLNYNVQVSDNEDGSLTEGGIAAEDVYVTINYLPEGADLTEIAMGHQKAPSSSSESLPGKKLIDDSDCRACHNLDKKSVGPSYHEVADRYRGDKNAVKMLAQKIIKGGGGNWGDHAMAAHPQVSEEDASEMVNYILSLTKEKRKAGLPVKGTYTLNEHLKNKSTEGSYVLRASYTDKGANNIESLTSYNTIILKYPSLKAIDADSKKDANNISYGGKNYLGLQNNGFFIFKNIDFTGISHLYITGGRQNNGGTLEFRADDLDGELLGTGEITPEQGAYEIQVDLLKTDGVHDLYIVLKNGTSDNEVLLVVEKVQFHQNNKGVL